MKTIELTRGAVAIIDDEDYERLVGDSWELNRQGRGYGVRKGRKGRGEPRTVHMHRAVLNAPAGVQIDHINGNSLDNRKCNLRYADTQKNAFNRKKPNVPCSSKYKGVFRRKNRPSWYARIKYNDKHIELGVYPDEDLAAAAYNFASKVMFGEFRRENTGAEIPELSLSQKRRIFDRCKRRAEQQGWHVDTKTYRSFYFGKGGDGSE